MRMRMIVALALAWWVDHPQRFLREREAANDAWWMVTLTNGDDPNGEAAFALKALREKYEAMPAPSLLPNPSAPAPQLP